MPIYKEPAYTDAENAIRLWDVENAKDLLARRAYYLINDWRKEELNDLWVQKPENRRTASLGSNWGYYVGLSSIMNYYADGHNALQEARAAAAGKAKGEGFCCSHTVNTGNIILAYDGKTARGLFYDVWQQSVAKADGADTDVVIGPVAVDFIKEDGVWKIWHLFQGADHVFRVGEDYASVPIPRPAELNPVAVEFGEPDIKMITYDPDFGWADHYPGMPEPYESFSDATSYGPEGHPNYVKEALK